MTWESSFESWANPPGETEREKMENAERAIKTAIGDSTLLDGRNVTVFPQGSYRNRTSVRQDSDVDICVLCADTFYFGLPNGMKREQFGLNSPATYEDAAFRADLDTTLRSRFGAAAISLGNKAWDVHENTYRVDADVVACFEYRDYSRDGTYRSGTAVLTRSGTYIMNFPNQSYECGKAKNDTTSRRFRACVRILKRLSGVMIDQGVIFTHLPSFLIESLVWNVPDSYFGHDSYTDDVRAILAHLCDDTRSDESCKDWCEVNGIKYLFHPSQQWTRNQVNSSLNAAWRFLGFQ